jgi:SurA N-terminal domain/PPIC-type PPIASE domain
MDNSQVIAIVQIKRNRIFAPALLALGIAVLGACGGSSSNTSAGGSLEGNETAAKVNGKVITMESVDRAVKQQAQGQESKLSPLELAGARMQVLQSLVEQEVMFQKAEKESAVPTEEEVTAEINKRKTQSGKSQDQIAKEMKESGLTDAYVRESVRKDLAIQKLIDKVTGKIEPPKDSEIDAFYNGNKEAFVKKKGVKLAAIVVDPANKGEGDTTVDDQSAVIKANEIIKQLQSGMDFATVARDKSEDESKFQNGDIGYVSEEELKQTFPANVAAALMNPEFQIGKIVTAQLQGKYYIIKLQERSDKDEELTLDSPGVRGQVTDELVKARKQLLSTSYQAIAMNEAKIENFLAQKLVANPNELSGARPANAGTVNANSTSSSSMNGNTTSANANSSPAANTNVAANTKATAANTAKPAATAPGKSAPAGKTGTANANKGK